MSNVMAGVRAASQEEREAAGDALVEAVAKEIEPLLNNEGKGPFFGGSERLTFAEVGFFPLYLYTGFLSCCLEVMCACILTSAGPHRFIPPPDSGFHEAGT